MDREDESIVEALVGRGALPPAATPCPDENRLAAFADQPGDEEEIERHLSLCASCRAAVAALGAGRAPEPPVPPAAEAPRSFGPYTIVRRLGEGGMGIVYEAVHPSRGRPEALKVLKGGFVASPTALRSNEELGPSNVPGWPWTSATMRLPSALTA